MMPRERYVWDPERSDLVPADAYYAERQCGTRSDLPTPQLQRDYEGYRSPVAGHGWVEGRAARREDLKRAGCIDARDFNGTRLKPLNLD